VPPSEIVAVEPRLRAVRIWFRMNPMARDLVHLSDEALVALVARGEEDALAALYDRFGRTAYGLALRVVRDAELAEDVVQEAFLSLWRNAGRFVPERSRAGTWLLTLVHRRAVDLVRREERRRTEPIESAPEAADATAEETPWLRLERERVRAALASLPDAQREAIELAYYGGFTQAELADRLGQPLGTIKSRMFAGLARLGELLRDTETGAWKTEPSTN
jgi:RNA polymerase sigma factor (sigma-70 family)